MARNIYLVGFMGTGKSTVGKLLAIKLGRRFIEMDETIENLQGITIPQIFALKGEAFFRKLEGELLSGLSKQSDLVVSCGGGVVCDQKNIDMMKSSGLLIKLSASASTIFDRVKNDTNRPLLQVDDPMAKIKQLLDSRERFYSQAEVTVETDQKTPQDIVTIILKALSRYG